VECENVAGRVDGKTGVVSQVPFQDCGEHPSDELASRTMWRRRVRCASSIASSAASRTSSTTSTSTPSPYAPSTTKASSTQLSWRGPAPDPLRLEHSETASFLATNTSDDAEFLRIYLCCLLAIEQA
jgi:hypothetical protein